MAPVGAALGYSLATLLGLGPSTEAPSWLDWQAPDSCKTARQMQGATEGRLGRAVEASDVRVRGIIEDHGSDGLILALETTRNGVTAERTIVAAQCDALVDAASLVVALSIDPLAVTQSVRAARQPRPPTPLEETSATTAVPAVPLPAALAPEEAVRPADPETGSASDDDGVPPSLSPSSRPRAAAEVTVGLQAGIEFGALPRLSGGPQLVFGVLLPRLRLEAGGWYAAPRTARRGAASVRVQLGAAVVRGCGRFLSGPAEVPLCAGLDVGASRGEGSGAPNPRSVNGLWVAPTVSTGVHGWILPRLALSARLEVAAPLTRTAFELRDPGDSIGLFEPAPVSGRVWIGVEGKIRGPRDGSKKPRRRKGRTRP
ncbi:MAG: hypothetical protein ACRBN8_40315 [Nannocystales bacterium]